MTARYFKYLLVSLLIFGTSACVPEKEQDFLKETIPAVTTDVMTPKNFSFYKSFAFCDSRVGYFSQEEADSVYADKTFEVRKETSKPVDAGALYGQDQLACIAKNLALTPPLKTVSVPSTEDFPFDTLVLFNDTYLIAARDGYFFAFSTSEKAKAKPVDKKAVTHSAFTPVFNKTLTGLSVIDENEQNIFKKYGTDSVSVCMCNAPSIFIDETKNDIILFNSCESAKPLADIEHKHVLKITSIKAESGILTIHAEQNVTLTFTETGDPSLFELAIQGKIPTDYIGQEWKTFFTSEPQQFVKATCGDYDG